MVPTLFASTIFLSAALSFLVQPLIGKQLLPVLGGTPAVWNSCLVFFQSVLLLAYLFAHRLAMANIRFSWRVGVHALVMAAAACAMLAGDRLKPNESLIPTDSEMPIASVLAVLAAAVGAPYFVLAMTAPLLQAWFARFGRNPYPLYAASNLGSFAGLLGYPFLVEPTLPLGEQRAYWMIGFAIAATAIGACGIVAAFGGKRISREPAAAPAEPPTTARIAKWVALAALPSSLLMSTTTHLTTDIAPVPLLWVLPLSLYLLSFAIVFAGWSNRARAIIGRLAPMFLCFLAVALLTRANTPIVLVAGVHLLAFFLVALLCHGELAANRPPPAQLTAFFLWLSVGGVLGGLINTLVAPVIFAHFGNLEYPIALVLAGLVRPPLAAVGGRVRRADAIWPLALGAFTALLVVGVPWLFPDHHANDAEAVEERLVRGGLSFGLPAALAFALVWRPVRFTLCLAALMLVGSLAPNPHGRILQTHRNYFGTLRVTLSDDGRFHRIVHGTTLHGQQLWPGAGRPEPATYYHRKGPFGRLMGKLPEAYRQRVGVVGLGCGATAAYADEGQRWTFYEIDPAVVSIARDSRFFTFLSTCPPVYDIVLGDARRRLAGAESEEFDLLVLDAFSSDSVPVHLLTREAFELYLAKLKPDGVLALHLSNRYLDLPSLVARVLDGIDPQMTIRYDHDLPTEANARSGQTASTWVFVARTPERIGKPDPRWTTLKPTAGPIWTDDFSNLLSAWNNDAAD